MAHREVIPIFLASPGDISAERKIAQEVVNQVNTDIAAEFDLHLDLYGWERQPPDFGRPQGQINPNLEEAELFIGLLWRTWGSPPGGPHRSGFEEEFELAYERRAQSGELPVMWLFFRDVDAGQLSDAGSKLKKVIAFRKRIQEDHLLLYKPYRDEADWREQLYRLLANYVARRAQRQDEPEPEQSLPSGTQPEGPPPNAETSGLIAGTAQQLEALARVQEVLQGAETKRPGMLDAARLLLASFTWVSSQTQEVLGTHEVNLLYTFRAELEATGEERMQLIRSMLLGGGLRPGWFWLADFDPTTPDGVLAYLGSADNNADVRRRALLTMSSPEFLDEWPDDVTAFGASRYLKQKLKDDNVHVHGAAFDLLVRWGTDEALNILREAYEDPKMKNHAATFLAQLLLTRDPDEALAMAVSDRIVGIQLEDELLAHASAFTDSALESVRTHDLSWMRKVAVQIDEASGRTTEERARRALDDPDREVRAQGLDVMLDHGWDVDAETFRELVDEFLLPTSRRQRWMYARAARQDEEALRAQLNWYLAYTDSFYAALAQNHFAAFGDELRRDLADGFEAHRQRSRADLEAKFGRDEAAKLIEGSGEKLEASRTRDIILAALGGIEAHGEAADAELAFPYVEHADFKVRIAAVKAIHGVADHRAAQLSRELALEPEATAEAARLALEVDATSALALSHSEEAKVMAVAAEYLDGDEGLSRLRELLDSPGDDVRLAAVRRIGESLDQKGLAELLDSYTAQDRNFYNVVAWLDCLVYAPEPLRSTHLATMS